MSNNISFAYPPQAPAQLYPPSLPPAYAPMASAPPYEMYYHECPNQIEKPTLDSLIQKYDIRTSLSQALYTLKEFDIVFICDDSGSMDTPCESIDSSGNVIRQTRWKEAEKITTTITDFSLALDGDGLDLYFFSQPNHLKVTSVEQVKQIFRRTPNCGTPIVKTLRQVYNEFKARDKDTLVIIITDGEPSGGVDETFQNLTNVINEMIGCAHPKFRISTVLVTDNDNVIGPYNQIDKKFDCFDVSDDYMSELSEIKKVQGQHFDFQFGDYVCKILLSPVCKELDHLDEKVLDINNMVKNFTTNYDNTGKFDIAQSQIPIQNQTPIPTHSGAYQRQNQGCCIIV